MIQATRSNLLMLKERRQAVVSCAGILKGRRQALIKKFLEIGRPLLASREETRSRYGKGIEELQTSLGLEGEDYIASLALISQRHLGVELVNMNILGLRYRDLHQLESASRSLEERGYDYPSITPHLDEALQLFETIVEEMLAMAKTWIMANPESAQAFDQKGFKIPGGTAASPHNAGLLFMAPAIAFRKLKGLLPAPTRIIALAAESTLVDVDTALRIASRGLTELVISPEAKNLITTFFFGMNALKSGESRPKGPESKKVTKLGILGAGMMGQGIAYVAAKAGIEVVLKDVTIEAAQKGKAYSEKLLDKAISRGWTDESAKQKLLGRISATASAAHLQGCDLIVEAVFEDMELKATVTREAEPQLKEGGVFASNTSTLPITELSRYSAKPAKFIGIHFFSPVDRMPLVEIITGKETTHETLALAFDFVQQIGKVPIVVNDSRGFFTSRVFGTYLDEGCRLLTEGVDPQLIEAWSSLAGMPVGPLAVHDEISLALTQTVGITNGRLDAERGENFCATSIVSTAVAGRMVDEFGRKGRAFGSGFYDYGDDRSKKLWPELSAAFAADGEIEISRADLQDRVIFRQVLESLHCLQEGVFRNLRDGNIGSIMGIGFPTHTGGVFQYINTYGIEKFIKRCNELESRYGERFKAPAILIEQASSGEWFQ